MRILVPGGMDMKRKLLVLVLILSLLAVPARAQDGEKLIALTFDDGPSGRFTRRLLEGLEERDAKATFFLCGYRMEQMPGLAEEIADAGHEIGLHGYSHDSMAEMSVETLRKELDDTAQLLGWYPTILRPPGGASGEALRQVSAERDLAIIHWSVDPKDWATSDTDEIVRRVVEQAGDGDVILMHDMSDSSVDAALEIIDELSAQGFRFVTVSELAKYRGVGLMGGKEYTCFAPGK